MEPLSALPVKTMPPRAAGQDRNVLTRLRERLAARPDSEHEQAIIRVILGGLIIGYCIALSGEVLDTDPRVRAMMMIAMAGQGFAVAIMLAIVIWPAASVTRRCFGIALDTLSLSLFLYFGGELAAPLYPIYLWVTLGYGFRYGPGYLILTAAASLAGFLLVISTTAFWLDTAPHLAAGLLLALIVIPGYALTLLKKLTRAKAIAEEASKAKSRFLANMSHELRTPLTAVIGISDLLRDTLRDGDQREMVSTIKTAARTLLHLINDILDFSKIEAGKLTRQEVAFDLHSLMAGLVSMVEPQIAAKGLNVSSHVGQGVPGIVVGDGNHLQQVLLNLLGNAIKFTEKGNILLSVAKIDETDNETRLQFEVVDSGIGIPKEKQARIFDSFTQADDTIGRQYGGTGLGLSIVRQIVEILGGGIEVSSEPGQGSVFRIWIAFRKPESGGMAAPNSLPVRSRVYLVSDRDAFLSRVERPVLEAGGLVRSVPNIPQLVRSMAEENAASAKDLSVVIIDADCVSSSYPLLAAGLYEQFGRKKTRLILCTNSPPLEERRDFHAFLDEAFTAEDLLLSVHAALAASESAGEFSGGQPPAINAESGQALSILLVEDNRTNGMVLTKLLNRAGHKVTLVDNGDDALDRLDAEEFDLVFTDLNLPGMSGLDLFKMYRVTHLDLAPLPFIAITADVTEETRAACLEAGLTAVIGKPVDTLQLLTTIETLFPARGSGSSSGDAPDVTTVSDAGAPINIAVHPRFGRQGDPVLDTIMLRDLYNLGGSDPKFFRDLVSDFLGDGESLLADLEKSVAEGDVAKYRSVAHGLRGSLADIGARRMYHRCLDFRSPSPDRLKREGSQHIEMLRQEFADLRDILVREANRLDPDAAIGS